MKRLQTETSMQAEDCFANVALGAELRPWRHYIDFSGLRHMCRLLSSAYTPSKPKRAFAL